MQCLVKSFDKLSKVSLIFFLFYLLATLPGWTEHFGLFSSPFFEPLSSPLISKILFGLVLATMIVCFISLNFLPLILIFLIPLILGDLNRIESEVFYYLFVLTICFLAKRLNPEIAVKILRLFLGTFYFWAGANKINQNFLLNFAGNSICDKLSFGRISFCSEQSLILGLFIVLVEVAIGLSFFRGKFNKPALFLLLFTNLAILVFYQKLGADYYTVGFPWVLFQSYISIWYFQNRKHVKRSEISKIDRNFIIAINSLPLMFFLKVVPYQFSFHFFSGYYSYYEIHPKNKDSDRWLNENFDLKGVVQSAEGGYRSIESIKSVSRLDSNNSKYVLNNISKRICSKNLEKNMGFNFVHYDFTNFFFNENPRIETYGCP